MTNIDFFVFGDSLSDTGNLFQKTAGLLPPSPLYFNGRFSNGALSVEQLAQSLGLSLSSSTNFAIGEGPIALILTIMPNLNLAGCSMKLIPSRQRRKI